MLKFAQHLQVNAADMMALTRQASQACDFSNLAEAVDLPGAFATARYAAEWPEAQGLHADLTRTRDGRPTAGGVNPGDQRAIYTLIRHFKPSRVLEVGTHLGYSTLNIALALQRNAEEMASAPGHLTTVDILDVNDGTQAAWRRADARLSPRQAVAEAGHDQIRFVASPSVDFLRDTRDSFDFIFLDGDHAAPVVYREIQLLQRVMAPNCFVLLHDYFPGGRALWKGNYPNTGPWRAVRRLRGEGLPLAARPLGALPWPTKCGTHLTSLAQLAAITDPVAPELNPA